MVKLKEVHLQTDSLEGGLLCFTFDNGFNIAKPLSVDVDKTELVGELQKLISIIENAKELDYPTQKDYEEAMLDEQPTN